MLLISAFLSKTAARLVLVAYLTQVFAPLAHAMEDPLRLEAPYPTIKSSFQAGSSCRQEAMGYGQYSNPVGQALGGQGFGQVDYAAIKRM